MCTEKFQSAFNICVNKAKIELVNGNSCLICVTDIMQVSSQVLVEHSGKGNPKQVTSMVSVYALDL